MNTSKRIAALVGGGTLLVGALGTGVAMASSSTQSARPGRAPAAAVVTAAAAAPVDTDNVQLGDQTTPDAAGTAAENSAEAAGAGNESGPSDAPGGHADAAGSVDHQFQGQE